MTGLVYSAWRDASRRAWSQAHRASIEPMYSRFFAFIGLFAFGMFTLVVSDNLLTLFVGWEIMGLCSYLLIGFWYGKPSARAAMIKAFMTTRVAMCHAAGYRLSVFDDRHFELPGYFLQSGSAQPPGRDAVLYCWAFCGGSDRHPAVHRHIGKSAQWPLHVWLRTPWKVRRRSRHDPCGDHGLSRCVHGDPVYPLLSAEWNTGSDTTHAVHAFIGPLPPCLRRRSRWRRMTSSVCWLLNYLAAWFHDCCIGVGGYVAATFHLVTHAFFKALLFLGSGSVIHGVEHGVLHTGDHHVDPQDMRNMGGLRHKMPVTFWTFAIGGLALAGFPLFTAGFWSKDEIFADAFKHARLCLLR